MRRFATLLLIPLAASLLSASPSFAQSEKVRLSGLGDVSFGSLGYGGDVISAQSLCAFSSMRSAGYTIVPIGDGANGELILRSGLNLLDFDVLWSPLASQTNGDQLIAMQMSQAYTTDAQHHRCMNGPSSTASLIVRIRSQDISAARAGVYSGSLTLILGPV